MVTCENLPATESWLNHMGGASALLGLRSSDDWNNTANLREFLQVCYIAVRTHPSSKTRLRVALMFSQVMGCLIQKTCVPQSIARLTGVFQSDRTLLPASRLLHIMCKFARFHASIERVEASHTVEMILAAIDIDNELSSWVSELPSTWSYDKARSASAETFYGDSYHIYQSSWHACVWNYYRICRIILHTILLRSLDALASPVSSTHPALVSAYRVQRRESQAILATLPLDICATIPYQLGLNEIGARNQTAPKPSAVFSILGLLQVFVRSADAALASQSWLSKTFEYIGHQYGAQQALALRKFVE